MPGYGTLLTKVRWSLMHRGVSGTLRIVIGRLGPKKEERTLAKYSKHPFDVEHGVDTSGLIDGIRLLTGHKHDAYNTAYWGVAPSRAREVLRRWMATPRKGRPEDYTLFDMGCGKGRMVLLASEVPFKEVIGVELNAELAKTAASNVTVWKEAGRAKCPVRVVQRDATEMELPEGQCVFYLYNPFEATVLRRLLGRLEAHFAGRPDGFEVLYLFPKFDSVFAERPGYELLWRAEISESEEDRAVDPVSTGEHPCSAYRYVNPGS